MKKPSSLHTPTVSFFERTKKDEWWYYISFQNTAADPKLDLLFMRVEVARESPKAELRSWAYDAVNAEYNQVRAAFPDERVLECLRFQQLLYMMVFFLSYKSSSKSDTIRELDYIAVDPCGSPETSSFFRNVVNGGVNFSISTTVSFILEEPTLRITPKIYGRLLARYLNLYRPYHEYGTIAALPAALTIAGATRQSAPAHPAPNSTSTG